MGADSPTGFDQLVAQVHDHAATPDAAGLLDAAVAMSAEHAATADRLLDHFVRDAREAGMSWTDIGGRLGVSKQAARQRFADRTTVGTLPFAARPASRLRACLDSAGQQARTDGAHEVGTHHLLTGLLADGVAAAILERLGVHAEAVRAASQRLFGPPTDGTGDETPPMSSEAICALDAAACNAAANASGGTTPEVRTEHLLAVLALDPGSRARRVLNDLGVDIAAVKRELQCYITINPTRPARWWKRRPPAQHGCSFCGRTSPAVGQLVNGPGVAICSACVALARDILDNRQPTT
jgi:ClpX C4-type zinc finger/Clp amino terminal domain, pathogenicity island component